MSTDDEARALFAALQAGEAGGLLGALARRGQRRAAAFDFATAEIDAWDPQLPAEAAWDGLLAAEDRRSGARAAEAGLDSEYSFLHRPVTSFLLCVRSF